MASVTRTNPKAIQKVLKRYRQAGQSVLAVGFPSNGKGGGAAYEDGTPILKVAMANNFGMRFDDGQVRIPRRDFMTPGGKLAVKETREIAKAFIPAVNKGTVRVEYALKAMGPFAEAAVKQAITDLRTPPNSPVTIAAKGSSNPLIDDGIMRGAVTHVVRKLIK